MEMSWEDNPMRSGVVKRFGKIQKVISSPSSALSTALKLFPSSQSPMDFSQTHDGVNRGLICASKNTDAHFGAELSPYMWPREAILALPSELINSLLEYKGLLLVCALFGLDPDYVDSEGFQDCI